MIRVKGYGPQTAFMGTNYTEVDYDAERIRVTIVPGSEVSGASQLLELLDAKDHVVAVYGPGKWVSAYVVELAHEVPRSGTVTFKKED